MKTYVITVCSVLVSFTIGSCAYLGFHGPSVKMYPDIHQNVSEDWQCLECHHGDDPQGPITPHPNFSGCLKCHGDEISSYKIMPENRTRLVSADERNNATPGSGSAR